MREIEREIQRRGGERDGVRLPMVEQDPAVGAMKMQVAMMVGAWQSELRTRLDGVVRQIERSGEPDEHWEMLRRQVEIAQPEIARYVTTSVSSLTKIETKIFLLTGLNTPRQKIAEILNLSVQSIDDHRGRIYRKLNLAADVKLDEIFGAMLR